MCVPQPFGLKGPVLDFALFLRVLPLPEPFSPPSNRSTLIFAHSLQNT